MSQAVLYDVQGPRARRRVLISSVVGGLLLAVGLRDATTYGEAALAALAWIAPVGVLTFVTSAVGRPPVKESQLLKLNAKTLATEAKVSAAKVPTGCAACCMRPTRPDVKSAARCGSAWPGRRACTSNSRSGPR